VGLPGELIEFHEGRVYVNGRALTEPYLPKGTITASARRRFKIGENEYFVLGDNRLDSFDSRIYGPISTEDIMGSYSRTFWACR
jgi:signal peptidase I